MTSIVGHKIERYLTAEKPVQGLPWIVTHHQVITELRATKGWLRVSHERKHHTVDKLPPLDQWRNANVTEFHRKNATKAPRFQPIEITEKAKLRHKWYRIEKAAAAFRASLPNENRLDVE